MEIREVRYFLAVCESSNFTRAAKHCHVTTSALSRGIRKLEGELGAPLFHRTTTQVALTDFGRLIRPHFEQIVADAAAAQRVARRFLKLEDTPLSVGVMASLSPARFLTFLGTYRCAHRGVSLRLVEGTADQLRSLLTAGQLDLAIMARRAEPDRHLRATLLYREGFCVAVPSGHRFLQRKQIPLREALQEEHLLRTGCEYQTLIEGLLREPWRCATGHLSERP